MLPVQATAVEIGEYLRTRRALRASRYLTRYLKPRRMRRSRTLRLESFMRSPVPQIATIALVLHMGLGCCFHHAHHAVADAVCAIDGSDKHECKDDHLDHAHTETACCDSEHIAASPTCTASDLPAGSGHDRPDWQAGLADVLVELRP